MADPNWLLSAVAQSTAALVAIVGGLVVARLISLSAERTTLERQIQMLTWRKEEAEVSAERLRTEMVAEDANDSIEAWTEAMLRAPNGLSDGELLEVSNPGDWLLMDYREHLTAFRSSFDEGLAVLRTLIENQRFEEIADADLPTNAQGLTAFGVELPSEPEQIRVWDKIIELWHEYELDRRRKDRSSPFDIFGDISRSFDIGLLDIGDPALQSANLASRVQDERDYLARQAEGQALEHELTVLRASLADVTDPGRLWWGFAVLVVFALLGIGLPMILMAMGPIDLSIKWRVTVIISFGTGLSLLFAYIAMFVKALQSSTNSEAAKPRKI